MITICAGWHDVHDRLVHVRAKVLVPEDGQDTRVSHGICPECRDAFLERAAIAHAAKEALCLPPTNGS